MNDLIEQMAKLLAALPEEQQRKAALYLGAYIAGMKDASQ